MIPVSEHLAAVLRGEVPVQPGMGSAQQENEDRPMTMAQSLNRRMALRDCDREPVARSQTVKPATVFGGLGCLGLLVLVPVIISVAIAYLAKN